MVNPAEPVIGGLLIELCFAFILYGITTLQTFMYFQKYTDDRLSLKTLVSPTPSLIRRNSRARPCRSRRSRPCGEPPPRSLRPRFHSHITTGRILESVHTGFCMQFIYAYIIAGFGDYANFLNINWCVAVTTRRSPITRIRPAALELTSLPRVAVQGHRREY
ncbi:hypothetical protein TRAPUB_9564 [Trametes pubescens]|uniref:Uncharacterized protein n=1 Tax=Trametes pubescens TaxID=154538 RepID=A0A1M2W1Y8_TRAPU|nr:hypothetical protein TRAPUB_9564 [Trametes pubescens]